MHEALSRVWKAGTYRPQRGGLGPFLGACVRNEAVAAVRARERRERRERRVAEAPSPEPDPADRHAVADALARLPSEQRAALDRVYYRGMTHTEIAAELRIPLGTVKGRIALGLRRLAADLAREGNRHESSG